jgi:hypothetical protein
MYDAYSIEVTIRNLCQDTDSQRGRFYDADVFRCGNPDELKEFLEKLSQAIKDRISLNLPDSQKEFLVSAIDGIKGAKLWITQTEPEDYHWLVIAGLVSIINLLIQK